MFRDEATHQANDNVGRGKFLPYSGAGAPPVSGVFTPPFPRGIVRVFTATSDVSDVEVSR
ncbi:MAG: hypothetical protein M3O50_15610 [Myxococcota bacterium]|nr:hypothetical protein [Myxococcota bacterium]